MGSVDSQRHAPPPAAAARLLIRLSTAILASQLWMISFALRRGGVPFPSRTEREAVRPPRIPRTPPTPGWRSTRPGGRSASAPASAQRTSSTASPRADTRTPPCFPPRTSLRLPSPLLLPRRRVQPISPPPAPPAPPPKPQNSRGFTLATFPWFTLTTIGGQVATGSHGSSLSFGSLSDDSQLLAVDMVLANGAKSEAHCAPPACRNLSMPWRRCGAMRRRWDDAVVPGCSAAPPASRLAPPRLSPPAGSGAVRVGG